MSEPEGRNPYDADASGPVEIRLPADPTLVSAVRLMASGMASSTRSTIDAINDVKLAVSEVMLALIEHGSADHLTITLAVQGSAFVITGCGQTFGFDPDDPDVALSQTVLAEICSDHSVEFVGSDLHISATVPIDHET